MNRLYLIGEEGNILFIEPTNEHLELLNLNSNLRKISSNSWCFWCLSSNFQLKLYVPKLIQIRFTAETYENQRRYNLLKKDSFTSRLLPSDRYAYSSEDGLKSLPKEIFKLPSDNWSWDSDWYYEENSLDGWEYALDFQAHFHKQFIFTDCVRRRKWLRTRSFNAYDKVISIENPNDEEFAIDIATGGWEMQFCEKGFISVWCITNKGRAYYRENVSHSNVEGNKWRFIEAPDSVLFLSVSCSSSGHTWFITSDGMIVFRNGIDFSSPYGTSWTFIDGPASDCCTLKQLSISTKSIWALDNKGNVFYRIGVDSANKTGSKWALISGLMSCISVSLTGQLWGISFDKNSLYYREGVTDDCLEGENWKILNLTMLTKNQVCVTHEIAALEIHSEALTDNEIEPNNEEEENDNQKSIYDMYSSEDTQEITESHMNLKPVNLESWIEQLKMADSDSLSSEKLARSMSNTSNDNSNSDKKSVLSWTELSQSETITEIESFKFCDASILNLRELPVNWFKEKSRASSITTFEEHNPEWKTQILDELKRRNSSQINHINRFIKIDDESTQEIWSHKADMIFFKSLNSSKRQCSIETIQDSNKNETFVEIKVYNKGNNKIQETLKYNIKNIISVVHFVPLENVKKSGFAMYLRGLENDPYIFVTESEALAQEWISYLTQECCRTHSFEKLDEALIMTNKAGHVYIGKIDGPNVQLISQINGFLKFIEKHINGYTLGLGYNGKLWFLSHAKGLIQNNSKGAYLMNDELEFFVYENQRWNMLQGYSSLGLPTDRYHFSDETGKLKFDIKNFSLPNPGLRWISNWRISYNTPGGVDSDGWQYAIDFPFTYHPVRKPLDFVRRRRWSRKSRIRTHSMFIELPQSHSIASFSFDMELDRSIFPNNDSFLIWACDTDGNVLCSLLNKQYPTSCKWQYISSSQLFTCISIGVGPRVYALSQSGKIFFRLCVNESNLFCGKSWSELECKNEFLKLKKISAGNGTLWAIANNDDLYFRENLSDKFPEGTHWTKISNNIEYISVNRLNEVYAINKNGCLLYRLGINENPKGTSWIELINFDFIQISNRGK